MKNNKKGFTLIEIIAAITILGILTTIAVVSVTKIIESGKQKHYETAEKNMVLAGQSYFQQNRSQMPKTIGQKKTIAMEDLVEKNYIKPIKDYSENDCNMQNSYVEIQKTSQTNYSYTSYLDCPNYKTQNEGGETVPQINAAINVDAENSKTTASITIKGTASGDENITSYKYIIYRNSIEVKNTGDIEVTGNKKTISLELDLTDYTPSNIKIYIAATNKLGNTNTKTLTQDVEDTNPPQCIYLNEEDQKIKAWTKENRTVTVGCNDGEESKCIRETFTTVFNETTDYGYITIEDKSGNKTQCKVSVFVDKTPPTITSITNPTNGKATASEFSLILKGNDQHSGIAHWRYKDGSTIWNNYSNSNQEVFTTPLFSGVQEKTVSISACDVVGNCSNATPTKIHIVNDMCESTVANPSCSKVWSTSPCTASCGGGTQYQFRECDLVSVYDQTVSCPGTIEQRRNEDKSCNTQNCCSETEVDYYGGWSSCSKDCGGGTKYRNIYLKSKYNGQSCGISSIQDEESCNTQACEHTHDYGGCYNCASGEYVNYWEDVATTNFSYGNCGCKKKHCIEIGQKYHKQQCIICGHKNNIVWCPDAPYFKQINGEEETCDAGITYNQLS